MRKSINFQFKCKCQICKTESHQIQSPNNHSCSNFVEGIPIKFCSLLKRLLGYKLKISEILQFKDAQLLNIYYNENNLIKEKSRAKEKFSLLSVKLFLDEHRKSTKLKSKRIGDSKCIEAAICIYKDGNSQIMSEHELSSVLVQKKNTQLWNSIQYIQNYIQIKAFQYIDYSFDTKYPLMDRAKQYVDSLTNDILNISKDYISQTDEIIYESQLNNNLLNINYYLLLFIIIYYLPEYLTLKIVAMLNTKNIKLLKGRFEYIQNGEGEWVLFGFVNGIIEKPIIESYFKRKTSLYEQIESDREIVKDLERTMFKNYEFMKQQIGLKFKKEKIVEDKASNRVFELLYPNQQVNFQISKTFKFQPQQSVILGNTVTHQTNKNPNFIYHKLLNMQHQQTKIDLDILKQQYNQQQRVFERELEQLRFQLSRADVTRLQAEKELMLLQDRAKERKIWNILDQQASMPTVVEGTRMFKTSKYTIGNMSEADRRQQLLLDYYRKAQAQSQPLYQQQEQMQYDSIPELPSDTQLLLPKSKQQYQKLDESLLNDLDNMKQQEQPLQEHDESAIIRNPTEYQKMLENQSIVQIMQEMKNNGQRPALTPPDLPQQTQYNQRQIKSEGDSATFIQPQYEQESGRNMDQEMQNEQFDLNESEIPKITEQPYEYEEQELSVDEEEDPLDNKIDDLLKDIKLIVEQKKQDENYNQVKQQLRVATQREYVMVEKQRNEHFKPINFAKNPPLYVERREPIKLKVPESVGTTDKLDELIKHLSI